MRSLRREVAAAVAAALLCLAAVAAAVTRTGEGTKRTDASIPEAVSSPAATSAPAGALIDPDTIGAATTIRPTIIRAEPQPDAPPVSRLRAGIVLPVTTVGGAFLRVLTPCEVRGWVASGDVRVHPRAVGTPRSLSEATIVVDAGHGGTLTGAVGPGGLAEKDANLALVRRLALLLEDAPFGAAGGPLVILTRDTDYAAGLGYRAEVANAVGAHVLVSVHNNADPDGPFPRPGTETYYQLRSIPSKRLAGLAHEELVRALEPFGADWVADSDAGAKYRVNASGSDYYALLRRTTVPAVIVEVLFVTNPTEEQLLRRAQLLDAAAGAVARALERLFGTDDPGSGFTEPYPRPPGPSGRLPSVCRDPSP